ncbi:MAG: Do family serine endopeptidase [Mangrovibacterium sp.]
MKDLKHVTLSLVIAIISAGMAIWTYQTFFSTPQIVQVESTPVARYANLNTAAPSGNIDLTYAAEHSVHAVVHVKVSSEESSVAYGNPFYEWFYGNRGYRQQQPRVREGSGSGVIISKDGYIATNNHVIDGADNIKVVLQDKREFKATLVGTDPTTDIALLKIEGNDFPFLKFANSDKLLLGEWVLAVGNPYNLTSTVTAGIVSAKSRNININENSMSIESFIQTDAAVNPGNSGGALVNASGDLVGINTAIASLTGSYSGYSFAVPSSIVEKVIGDLKEYGQVQRALLGIGIQNIDADLAQRSNLDKIEGVYVGSVATNSAADVAGIKTGDVILDIAGTPIHSVAKLQEAVSKYRPGDEVKVLAKRNGKNKVFNVTFKNLQGDTELIAAGEEFLGAKFEEVSSEAAYNLNIRNGLQVSNTGKGKLKSAGVKDGFIIMRVNKQNVSNLNDLKSIISQTNGGVLLEGIYPDGKTAYYVFSTAD